MLRSSGRLKKPPSVAQRSGPVGVHTIRQTCLVCKPLGQRRKRTIMRDTSRPLPGLLALLIVLALAGAAQADGFAIRFHYANDDWGLGIGAHSHDTCRSAAYVYSRWSPRVYRDWPRSYVYTDCSPRYARYWYPRERAVVRNVAPRYRSTYTACTPHGCTTVRDAVPRRTYTRRVVRRTVRSCAPTRTYTTRRYHTPTRYRRTYRTYVAPRVAKRTSRSIHVTRRSYDRDCGRQVIRYRTGRPHTYQRYGYTRPHYGRSSHHYTHRRHR